MSESSKMKSNRRALMLSAVAGTLAVALALTAWAQVIGERPVLHRDVPPPQSDASGGARTSSGPAVFGAQPQEGQNPAAFAYGAKILPAPEPKPQPAASEPIHGSGGFAVDRDTEARPDTNTGSDDTLHYVTVFNPSVLPFKRMSAMDSVRPDYTLFVANSGALEDLPVGGKRSAERELFWGDLVVAFQPGVDVAIPSVAPDMRILSYEVEPRIEVTFARDGSDNYFARTDEAGASGVHRLRFLVDAPAEYFSPQIPGELLVRDIDDYAPPGLIKSLPDAIQREAQKSFEGFGLTRETKLGTALDTLVEYFRDFEAKSIDEKTGNIYRDLFNAKAGVCRHRSFAFMITANGLGIPTRYVTNEAHAWVEVWVPRVEWIRVDLGGAALRMEVNNAEDKALHNPGGDDPFPQPDSYADNYTQLSGDISGLSGEQIAERRQTSSPARADSDFDPGAPIAEESTGPPTIGPGSDLPELPAAIVENKRIATFRGLEADTEGFRGATMHVSGKLVSDGEGVGSQEIQIYLAPRGQEGNDATRVGATISRDDGSFSTDVWLPEHLPLRDYEVYATTPGNDEFAPAVSD